MLIYVHGFNSSALSYKAGLVRKRMAELRRTDAFLCPELPPSPKHAVALLESAIEASGPETVGLIGSSLGGYYATWLAERYDVRTVLVNPAVRPYELLQPYVGPQKNLYTGAQYELTNEHVAQLRELEVGRITSSLYLLLVTTGDEVLDYREAVTKYRGCEQIVVEGGDHGFSGFERYIDRALAFCGYPREAPPV
jgi:predicted esterase YcpF (UPF0227 family)